MVLKYFISEDPLMTHSRPRSGFTLLELSIVIVIVAVVAAGSLSYTNYKIQSKQYEATVFRMNAIDEALLNYRRAYNRIPCPANIVDAIDAAGIPNFGMEATLSPGDGLCANANWFASVGSKTVAGGMAPTKTLRLPDEFAFDGWGRRIFYAVDRQFTLTNAFSDDSIPVSDINDGTTGSIVVNDLNGNSLTLRGALVLISYGKNGHGGLGRIVTFRRNASSTNAGELENCECNSSAVETTFDADFVQRLETSGGGSLTNSFDDIVIFRNRSQLRSANE